MKQWQKDYLKQYLYTFGAVVCVGCIFPVLLLVSMLPLPVAYSMGLEALLACLMLAWAWHLGNKAETSG